MIDPENLKKMSEDEIIEYCSDIAGWGFNDYEEWEQQSAVYGLLDLYKKQQKEIEFLTKSRIIIQINKIKELKKLEDFMKLYISKDKIKNLIENNEEDIDYSVHDIIDDLRKLLEEN